jgi:hypothetical protein
VRTNTRCCQYPPTPRPYKYCRILRISSGIKLAHFTISFNSIIWPGHLFVIQMFWDSTITNNSVALVCERTIPAERPSFVGEVSANFCKREGCRVASAADPCVRILGLLEQCRYFFLQVAPRLYSRGWVDHVPDPLLLRKSDSSGNRTRDLCICSQESWPLYHSPCLLLSKSITF